MPLCRRWAGAAALLLGAGFAAAQTPPPATPAAPALHDDYSLLDASHALPPLGALAPEHAAAVARLTAAATPQPPARLDAEGPLDWQFRYQRSRLDEAAAGRTLRTDPSTGFSRQADRDVLGLGLSWRLARTRLGLGYQLQSARPADSGGDAGFGRFLPGSEQATHAFTLGVTREFGAGAPPPPAAPLPPPLE